MCERRHDRVLNRLYKAPQYIWETIDLSEQQNNYKNENFEKNLYLTVSSMQQSETYFQ